MKNTVIFGVDFKDNTVKLLAEVIKYALKLKCSITPVHAVEYLPYYPYFPHNEEQVKEFHSMDIQWKIDQLKSYVKLHNVEMEDAIIEKGKTYEVLCNAADKTNARAIIVGVGQHYLFEELIGSTTEKVCRMAKQKVIIVNNRKKEFVKSILCAFDFSENSLASLTSATRFANFFKARLRVIHIHDSPQLVDDIAQQFNALVNKVVDNELDRIGAKEKINYDIVLRSGNPVLEILKAADEFETDLISIGSSGHNKLSGFFLGSTVAKIIRRSPCSIVVSPKDILN